MKKIGIYVHFPFCASKCAYCDFNSYANVSHMQEDYLKALVNEINYNSNKDVEIDTIFIGGGTPSIAKTGTIATIINAIKYNFNVLNNAEITIECNPNSVNYAVLSEWKEVGINRISIGLQTTNKNILKLIGRTHDKQDYINAIDLIKSFGFKNINTDLMIGLPKQKSSDVKYAINLCDKLGCKHISCYSLILEEKTLLYKLVNEGKIKLPKEEKVLGMYNTANTTLQKFGYSRYEVSNFAKDGYQCKHNINCWKLHEYYGFGAGAHGYIDNVRYYNYSKIEDYIVAINSSKSAIEAKEELNNVDHYEEAIMLGLRTSKGVKISQLDKYLGESFLNKYKESIDKYLAMSYISITDYLAVTDSGISVLNQIILDFVM